MKNRSKSKKQRILTVCYGNLHRSRTAEWLLHKNYNVESCGIWSGAIQPIKRRLIEFADQIVVMEQYMADDIVYRYTDAKDKITVLDVADTGICSELILELNGKLQAEGFRTLRITDINDAVKECRDWVNERIRDHFPLFEESPLSKHWRWKIEKPITSARYMWQLKYFLCARATQTEVQQPIPFVIIAGIAITAAVIGAGLGLLIYLMKRNR